jgi:hypothetical protein
LKFSPNLDKKGCADGILRGSKGFPIDKNVALIKWKKEEAFLPIEFTFWPSEMDAERYHISFEYTTKIDDIKDLSIYFSKEKISDVVLEGGSAKLSEGYIVWDIKGYKERGHSDTLEFTCNCSDPSEIFPIEVYFSSSSVCSDVSIKRIVKDGEETADFRLNKMFEVDKFTIVNE